VKPQEIVKRLDGVLKTSNGWQARCPAHQDNTQSLSIGEDNGKTLLDCKAGCKTEDVVKALGLEMRDLYPDAAGKRKLVATYPYEDENGKLLYEILRHSPKNFTVRRPDDNGGWIYSLDGTKLVPYQLPMILEYDSVLVTEGEKDADTGRIKLRLPATTNPFGTGKWREEYSPFLAGKAVILCPHKDEAENTCNRWPVHFFL
jgi:hypothetical protein